MTWATLLAPIPKLLPAFFRRQRQAIPERRESCWKQANPLRVVMSSMSASLDDTWRGWAGAVKSGLTAVVKNGWAAVVKKV